MRVVGGTARGRRLVAPRGRSTRPITDRAKEGIFNVLASLGGVDGAVVVDLYAGSGSFGIEALSRGAAQVVFVERSRAAVEAIHRNLEAVGLADRAEVLRARVETAIASLPPADVAFCDPPYADDPWPELLDRLDAELLVGHADAPIELPERWEEVRRRTYGGAHLVVARRRPSPPPSRSTAPD